MRFRGRMPRRSHNICMIAGAGGDRLGVGRALLAVNAAFLVAWLLKFVEGGYVPLSTGAVLFLVMAIWRWGRKATFGA